VDTDGARLDEAPPERNIGIGEASANALGVAYDAPTLMLPARESRRLQEGALVSWAWTVDIGQTHPRTCRLLMREVVVRSHERVKGLVEVGCAEAQGGAPVRGQRSTAARGWRGLGTLHAALTLAYVGPLTSTGLGEALSTQERAERDRHRRGTHGVREMRGVRGTARVRVECGGLLGSTARTARTTMQSNSAYRASRRT
jgi:hypothetical protein